MKTMLKMFEFASLTIVLACLVGCASQKFTTVGDPIVVGDKSYSAVMIERVQPWGTNACTLNLIESDAKPAQYSVAQPALIIQQPSAAYVPQLQYVVTNTHVANSCNQGSNGWAAGAFQNAVGDALLGGGIVWGSSLIRPARTNVNGGNSSASSSASSSSSAAAAAGR